MTTTTSSASGAASECTAAQAYLRLMAAVRAVLDDPSRASPAAAPLLAAPLAEADEALSAAGLAGNERDFLHLVAAQALGPAPDAREPEAR
ncbi:hypothetical protein ACFYYH_00940 [Streptomyces sp. NPDC002018]|uniref:hypothetical protein n=1 Tax=Streptomyces sp. NPDC002018 TaxID=3364629 RepID=UPI0036831D11